LAKYKIINKLAKEDNVESGVPIKYVAYMSLGPKQVLTPPIVIPPNVIQYTWIAHIIIEILVSILVGSSWESKRDLSPKRFMTIFH